MNPNSMQSNADDMLDYTLAKNNTDLKHIPGRYGLPILGQSLKIMVNTVDFLMTERQRYGLLFRTSMGPQKALVALGPDLTQQVLMDRNRHFSSKMAYEYSMAPYFGGGLMLRDFGEHRIHRRIMQTAFKTDALRSYVKTMNKHLQHNIQEWRSLKSMVFFSNIKRALLEVAADIFIGVDRNDPQVEYMNKNFLAAVGGLGALVQVNVPGFAHYHALRGRKKLHQYFRSLLPQKRTENPTDMFAYFAQELDEDGNLFSDIDVIQHVNFLTMAAHDTTTSALSNCMAALITYPEWQNRLREESQALGKEEIEYDDLEKLPSLSLFMHEVLRLHSSVPMVARRSTADTEMNGYKVPAHTMMFLAPCFSHLMEEGWDEPRRFDPERFNEKRAEHKRHPFNFIPFGGGAHKCIGMHFAMLQIRCFLHLFLLNYQINPVKNYKMPIQFQDIPFPRPKDGLPLDLVSLK